MKIWYCKIGSIEPESLPHGADGPMRNAIEDAYVKLTGEQPKFIFSGWGAKLTEAEQDEIDE